MKTNRITNILLMTASVAVLMNTGQVAGAAPATPSTVLVSSQTLTAVIGNNTFPTVDVSAYKQIRIMLFGGGSDCNAVISNFDSTGNFIGALETLPPNSFCELDKSYDTPGGVLSTYVYAGSAPHTLRLTIYGQKY